MACVVIHPPGVTLRREVPYVGAPEIKARRLVLAVRYHSEIGNPGLKVQVALAADSFDEVTEAAREIVAAAAKAGGDATPLVEPARSLVEAADIAAARDAFGPLSDAFIEYANEVGLGDLKVAFCPMANKSWVQADGSIANPFHGSLMLTCGVFK